MKRILVRIIHMNPFQMDLSFKIMLWALFAFYEFLEALEAIMNFLSDQADIAKCSEVSCKAETDPKATLIMLVDKAFSIQKKD